MQNKFPTPYQPATKEVDAKAKRTNESLPLISVVSLVTCVVSGILFVAAMHVADYDGETVVLMIASGALLMLSIMVGFLNLRVIGPMFILFPFCFVVALRHVGDMGQSPAPFQSDVGNVKLWVAIRAVARDRKLRFAKALD